MRCEDIVIVGAGPAGCATALRLAHMGIPSVLIDRSTFPRDKICGDAISGKVGVLLDRLDPAIMQRFRDRYAPTDVWGIRFYPPNGKLIELPFQVNYERIYNRAPGYVSKRMDFDHFLIEEVGRRTEIELLTGVAISKYERTERGYQIEDINGKHIFDCRLLLMADGAHSRFARDVGKMTKDHHHHAGAVRQYYRGVTGFHPDNFIELHFLKEINPGYFWIFSLPNGEANVGLGMRSDIIEKKKINLRKELNRIVKSDQFRARFADAEPLEKPIYYGLPLGSKKRILSGDHFMLCGDAGHLIDPLTGEGIGNALYSGFIAAELAEKCLAENRFDANYMLAYDRRIKRVLRKEMILSYRLQQVMQHQRITNFLTSFIAGNPKLIETLTRMYTDLELRNQLINPIFWWKQIRGSKNRQHNEAVKPL
ncbi:MAG: geranylgeranyl reductase family protein [Bacteroidota bacterium]